jgi:cytochrome c-type biogenesis protein CcmE
MTPRKKRFWFIVAGLVLVGAAVGLVLYGLKNNVSLYFTPTQVYNKEAPVDRNFRIGGLVQKGSLKREKDGLTVHFDITDTDKTMAVVYTGILPDLFKEGKGVVAQGKLDQHNVFHADEVLAKHDENYMPPEAADALKKAKAAEAAATKSNGGLPAAANPVTK